MKGKQRGRVVTAVTTQTSILAEGVFSLWQFMSPGRLISCCLHLACLFTYCGCDHIKTTFILKHVGLIIKTHKSSRNFNKCALNGRKNKGAPKLTYDVKRFPIRYCKTWVAVSLPHSPFTSEQSWANINSHETIQNCIRKISG